MEVSEGEYSSIYDIKKELHDELLLAENCENGDDGINAELENILSGLEYITKKLSNSIRINEIVWATLTTATVKINQIKKSILLKSMKNTNDKTVENKKESENISRSKSSLKKSMTKKNKVAEKKKTQIIDIIEDTTDATEDHKDDGENMRIFNIKVKRKPENIRDKLNTYCNVCDLKFSMRMLFLSHCSSIHDVKFKGMKTGQAIVLPKLKETETSSEFFINKKLNTSSNDKRSNALPSKRAPTPCMFCGKVFSNLSNKERHERISCEKADKEKIEKKKYKCNVGKCDRQFSKIGYLKKHELNDHENII